MEVLKDKKMNVPLKSWCKFSALDDGALTQAKNVASLPMVFHHVSLMSDAHQGFGMPIGGVVALKGCISPNMVGVDIGCGMKAIKTSLATIDTKILKKIMGEIRQTIPVGFEHHEKPHESYMPPYRFKESNIDYSVVIEQWKSATKQVGTLGGGNHFIEIQKGSDGHIWIMLHSGSRNVGYKVANYYNKIAKALNKKWYTSIPKEFDLAVLPLDSKEGQDYLAEMSYCLEFAKANRDLMMHFVKKIFTKFTNCKWEQEINIHHNYARMENHFGQNVMVHRKGAISARKEELGIIPGSQGTKSYIVKGKGNKESFMASSHGAGRKMSRKKARKELNLEDEIKKLDDKGILHSIRNSSDLDEASSAYKDIHIVIEDQKDLIDTIVELTPLGVIKG